MGEREIQVDIQKELSHGETRIFRTNAGQAFQGQVVDRTPGRIILSPYYPIRLGVEGMSDLNGWTSVVVTPDMVGKTVAVATAIEVKDRGKPTPEQMAYIHLVRRMGGKAGVARSVSDARLIIESSVA